MEASNGLLSNSGKRVMMSICMECKDFINIKATKTFGDFLRLCFLIFARDL
jgi:hypothetical protein